MNEYYKDRFHLVYKIAFYSYDSLFMACLFSVYDIFPWEIPSSLKRPIPPSKPKHKANKRNLVKSDKWPTVYILLEKYQL